MIVRRWAHFWSTLPEDEIEEDGDIVQNGGKSVTFAVADILRGLGCDVEGPDYAGDHGWDFNARKGGLTFCGQVTLIEGYWLLFSNPSWIDRIFRRQPPVYLELLQGLARELVADSRFSGVKWFDDDHGGSEKSPGASGPVDEMPRRSDKRKR